MCVRINLTSKSSRVLDFAEQEIENTRKPPGASPAPTTGNTHVSDRPPSWPLTSTQALSSIITSGEKLSGTYCAAEETRRGGSCDNSPRGAYIERFGVVEDEQEGGARSIASIHKSNPQNRRRASEW